MLTFLPRQGSRMQHTDSRRAQALGQLQHRARLPAWTHTQAQITHDHPYTWTWFPTADLPHPQYSAITSIHNGALLQSVPKYTHLCFKTILWNETRRWKNLPTSGRASSSAIEDYFWCIKKSAQCQDAHNLTSSNLISETFFWETAA